MRTEKDISTLKLLGITILMTMSCVSASGDFSTKQLSNLGIDLELALNGKTDVSKKTQKSSSNRHSRIHSLIKSGRENEVVKKLPFDHTPVTVQIQPSTFKLSLLNLIVLEYQNHSKQSFIFDASPTRAGPSLS